MTGQIFEKNKVEKNEIKKNRIETKQIFFFAMCILMLMGFRMSNYAEEKAGQVGVRYMEAQCTGKQLEQAISQNQEEDENGISSITGWKQTEQVEIQKADLGRSTSVKLIEMWGDVEQIFPQCLSGGVPLLKEDENGCMISEQAAYELFGGTDVAGKMISQEGQPLIIRGLLNIKENILIRQVSDTPFTYMEINGEPGGSTEMIRALLIQAGVVLTSGAVIEVDTFRGILHLMQALSMGILFVFVISRINPLMKNPDRKWVLPGKCILSIICLALIFFGIQYIWCFSEDFIPSKWSDFAFFGELINTQADHYKKYLDVPEIYRDRELFRCVKNVVLCEAGSILCIMICWLTNMKETHFIKLRQLLSRE